MNPKQIRAMWYGVGIAVLMLLLPPKKDSYYFLGYSPLFLHSGRVDTMLLLLQWFLVGVITLCAILTLHTHDSLPFALSLRTLLSLLSSATRNLFAFLGKVNALLYTPLFSEKEEEPPNLPPMDWSACGVDAAQEGEVQEALRCFNLALQHNPRSAKDWYNKGICLKKLKRYAEALDCFTRALKIDPQDGRFRQKWEETAKYLDYEPLPPLPMTGLQRLATWRGCGLFILGLLVCLAMYVGIMSAQNHARLNYGGRSVISR